MALITTLDSSVTDETLLPMGSLKLIAKKNTAFQGGSFAVVGPFTAKIIGDGYFTDSTYTQNLGKEITNASGIMSVKTSNGNFTLAIETKYNLTEIYYSDNIFTFDIEQLGYSSKLGLFSALDKTSIYGKIPDLTTMPLLSTFQANNSEVEGTLNLNANSYVSELKINGSAVVGTLENIALDSRMKTLTCTGCKGISGDVSALVGLSALREIALNDTSVSGSVTDLGKLVNATNILVHGTSVTGTCSELLAALTANGKTSGSVQVQTAEMDSAVVYTFPIA